MRKIKFRVWDKKQKVMRDVISINFLKKNVILLHPRGHIIRRIDEECVLMQYTGLKDKNGREIYEGDIVKATTYYGTSFQSNILGKVIFKEGAFMIETERGYTLLDEAKFIKVIGNVFENPELLKEVEK